MQPHRIAHNVLVTTVETKSGRQRANPSHLETKWKIKMKMNNIRRIAKFADGVDGRSHVRDFGHFGFLLKYINKYAI